MNTFENHKRTTDELMKIIASSREQLNTLMENLKSEQLDMELKDYFNIILARKNLTPVQVVKASGLQSTYAYQIISGEKKKPSRNKLLALAFAMELTLEETQQMLKVAQLPPLYPRKRQDLVVIFALKEHYNVIDVNEVLQDLQEELLI